jgi:hypothetical protein
MNGIKLVSAAFMVCVSTLSMAQNVAKIKKTADERVMARMEILNNKLGLNDAQSNKIKTAMLEREKTRDELTAKFGQDQKSIQENMKAPSAKCKEAMMSTMTDEQKAKFKELRKDHKQNKGEKLDKKDAKEKGKKMRGEQKEKIENEANDLED